MIKQKIQLLSLLAFFVLLLLAVEAQTPCVPIRYDIIVSEIMAKPSPEVGLPGVEYVELHNRLPERCVLRDWKIQIGNTAKALPEITIDSFGFAVVVAQKNLEIFSPYCPNLYALSSLSITDGGQSLTLMNDNNEVIHHVVFKQNWHSESIKAEGGWSLEMIDFGKPCAGRANWNSSKDKRGGTPGATNSIYGELVDAIPPAMCAATLRDSNVLRVHFNETVAFSFNQSGQLFHVNPEIPISKISEVSPDFKSLDVVFTEPIRQGEIYGVEMVGVVSDCAGNRSLQGEEIPFGVNSEILPKDLVINELLTSSKDGTDADYVEIFNNTTKILDLKDLKIGYGGDSLPKKTIPAASRGMQMMPHTYAVLCKNRETTLQQYVCKDKKALVQCDSLPNFASNTGVVFLCDKSLQTIDRLEYNEDMHYKKLLSTNGVSLERLSFNRATQDANNWFSAASTAGFGTPGYENSQSAYPESVLEFSVTPEVFSPDNDGFEDFAEVSCRFPSEGERASVFVYNDKGLVVRSLVNNDLCGIENVFIWDGLDDRGNVLPPGLYVVQLDSWNPQTERRGRRRRAVAIYR